jgi:hypothetical protein
LGRLGELKLEYISNEEFPPQVPWPIENFRYYLKRKIYSNNCHPKDVNCLMAKIRKELKSIETTGVRYVIKEILAKAKKAHKLQVTKNNVFLHFLRLRT